jgi:hypothetical protein
MGPWLIDVSDRSELERWLAGTPSDKVVMVVAGDSPRVRELLPNALDAAKLEPHRLVLWVKQPALLEGLPAADLLSRDRRLVSAVLTPDRRVAAWVYDDQIAVDDMAFAFAQAEEA